MKLKIRKIFILRKNIFKTLLAPIFIFGLSISLHAQDQKTLLKQWGDGPVQEYTVKGKKGNYSYTGINSVQSNIELLNMDNSYNWGIKLKGNKEYNSYEFHADNNAHAVVLYVTKPCDKNLKYYMMSEEKILRYRLCIVGEYMYLLKKWNSKNSYIIHKIFTKSVGKKSGNEAKKEKVSSLLFGNKAINKKAIRKMKEAGHEQIFQEYLDKEMVVQKQKTPAWNKKHAQYFANIEAEKKEFWKGDKEERAKLNRKMAESYARNSKNSASKKAGNVSITLTNSRSDVIHVFWRADSQERKATINGRGSTTISVPAGMKLYYSVNKNNTKQGFMTAPNSGSGKYRF